MGGIIIRSALPHLEKFKEKMYTYMSLSSPHLGTTRSGNVLIQIGYFSTQQPKLLI